MKYLIILFCTILSISCNKKISKHEFEKNVFYEIFPKLIDSTCIDTRIYLTIPPIGKPVFDSKGNYIYTDTSNVAKEQKIYEQKINTFKNDKARLVLAFNPTIKESHFDNSEAFRKYFGKELQPITTDEDSTSFSLNINKIRSHGKFYLLNDRKFPNGSEIWEKKYDFILNGSFSVNRIQFDKNKSIGVFSVGFYCGNLCGHGFRIFIKEINNHWQIVKVENTWIS